MKDTVCLHHFFEILNLMTYCHAFNPKGQSLFTLHENLETWKSVNLLIQEWATLSPKVPLALANDIII